MIFLLRVWLLRRFRLPSGWESKGSDSDGVGCFRLRWRSGAWRRWAGNGKPRQYYELRKYFLQQGPQVALTEKYVATALIPALNRMGIAPVGAFNLSIGPETPVLYLLLPCPSLETLVNAELHLRADQEFLAAADAFWNAPASSPAFVRVESTLLIAFEGWPQVTVASRDGAEGQAGFSAAVV